MSGASQAAPTLLCCGVLRAEVERLHLTYWPQCPLRFLESMLHMRPARLGAELRAAVDEELGRGRRVVLIYGDCCPEMMALESRPGVVRTRGNCYQLLAGWDEYRRLLREGAFFLLPEWAGRWEELFRAELGLNQRNATSLMRDLHRKLLYLDTGTNLDAATHLQACADYCGLPWESRQVPLDRLRDAIEEALGRLSASNTPS